MLFVKLDYGMIKVKIGKEILRTYQNWGFIEVLKRVKTQFALKIILVTNLDTILWASLKTGQYHQEKVEERISQYYDINEVEDELHFISHCIAWTWMRWVL